MPIEVAFADVDRVGQDPMHDAGRPEPAAAPRTPRAFGEPLEDLSDGHPLVDKPSVEDSHHIGLRLLDLEVRRDAVAGRDVAVAVGGLPGDPVTVLGLLDLPTAEPLGEDRPLILGDGALDLEQELVVRVV
ncbi:hypothetical protein V5E97_26775 [Singulisphaera sp. Ch08]|uniref:Uncharacterized protein n=1 Tax=Singulisphaera sp. Ch08 TaxID=3120278 RepID=A0AAU7CB30_9BACT